EHAPGGGYLRRLVRSLVSLPRRLARREQGREDQQRTHSSNETKMSDGHRERVARREGALMAENANARRVAVRPIVLVGRSRNLIDAPQKCIRVTEIREDINSPLRGQSCRSTPRANANERNADTATGTSIPNSVANIHGAGK